MSVYFISNGAYVKIGVAHNPKRRLKELQTGNPHKLELLRAIKGGYAEEAALHAHFARLRVNGEWFKYHPEMLTVDVVEVSSSSSRGDVVDEWRFEIKRKARKADKKNAGSTAHDDYYYTVNRVHRETKQTVYYGTLDTLEARDPSRVKRYFERSKRR